MPANLVIAGVSFPSNKIYMWSWKQGQDPVPCPREMSSPVTKPCWYQCVYGCPASASKSSLQWKRALGVWQEIQTGFPKALSMPSGHCPYNQGSEICESSLGKKGHTGQGCCF